jgi:Fe-S-cluster containining protein
VAHAACSLCQGWCCRNGADDAFLDEPTIARVRHAGLAPDTCSLLRLYIERVPAVGYDGSCIFHGKQGCRLDRSQRSDICNTYFCGGLQNYLTSSEAATATVVISGEGDKMRTSPVIMPPVIMPRHETAKKHPPGRKKDTVSWHRK